MDERTGYCIIRAGSGQSALINYKSIGAAFAMQMQTPFQDQQLVEFSRSISSRIRGKDDNEKYILRTLCREFVSPECAAQRKAGFILPFDGWLRAELWPIVEDTLSRASVERRGFLDYGKVAAMSAAYRSGRSSLSWVDIWAPVVLEIWLRTHCDPSPEGLGHPC